MLCFPFFLVSSRSFHSRMLIYFRNSFIDCCFLLFHYGSFTAFPILFLGLKPTILPTKMTHALINLFVSAIFSDLIYFRISFIFIDQSLSKFLSTLLNPFTFSYRLCSAISIMFLIIIFSFSLISSTFSKLKETLFILKKIF